MRAIKFYLTILLLFFPILLRAEDIPDNPLPASLKDITPFSLKEGTPFPIETTPITVTLISYRYGKGHDENNNEVIISWAKIKFESQLGQSETKEISFDTKTNFLSYNFYVTGSRSEVLLYYLPKK